jgi:hypothetical protein
MLVVTRLRVLDVDIPLGHQHILKSPSELYSGKKTMTWILSTPGKDGFTCEYDDLEDARSWAAYLLQCGKLVEVPSPDGSTVYCCYASQADADQDGAYAVQCREVAE